MSTARRVTTPFGVHSTAAEVIDGVDLRGCRAVVTGGSSGIGAETARVLATAGAEVTIAVRDRAAGERTAAKIAKNVSVVDLDLADLDSVKEFSRTWDGPLHLLVNNAGVMACPETHTSQGLELQFATNHLGHFALTTGLHTALAAEGARIICVSSQAHLAADVDLDDLQFDRRRYDRWTAYGQSKTANLLFAVEADRRWSSDGIRANALHPGGITTNLGRHLTPADIAALVAANPDSGRTKTIEEGAATSVFVATSPLLQNLGGRYFIDCNESGPNTEGTRTGYAAYAVDPDSAAALWEVSTQLTEHGA